MTDLPESTHLQQVRAQYFLADELFNREAPPTAETLLDELSSEKAAALLRKGQPLKRKRIVGDLILGQRDLKDPFEFELRGGQKAVLAGLPQPERKRLRWDHKIEIEGCFITGRVNFAGLCLRDSISISSTTFNAEVDFQFCQCDKEALFHHCRFHARAEFADVVFADSAHFNRTIFDDVGDFYNASFLDGASFDDVVFHAEANFSQSSFNSTGPFPPCFSFRNCLCHEAAYFENAKFEQAADFADAQFRRQVDFRGASFALVSFANADFHRLELKWEQIAGEKLLFAPIMLEGLEPSQPTLEIAELERSFNQRHHAPLHEKHRQYDILKAIFTKQGDYVSADGCFYEWKQVERRSSSLGLNPEKWIVKAFHYLNWLSCGYGTRPIRSLFFAIVIIILFAGAYTAIDVSAGNLATGVLSGFLRNLEFSFRTFMNMGTSETIRSLMTTLLSLAERLLGWLTLFLFVATYTRIMLR